MTNEQLIQKIKDLKRVKPRSEWTALNRDLLLSQINPTRQFSPINFSWREYSQVFVGLFRQRLLEPAVVMLLVLGFSVGSSLVVNASFYSLPGQRLYPVKLALENAQVAITPNENRKVELKIEFAQKRINEFDKLVSQTDVNLDQKKDRLTTAVKEFQKNVASVQEHITNINKQASEADLEKSLRMAISISSEAKELALALGKTSKDLTEEDVEVKEIVNQAVESAQAVSFSVEQLIKEDADSQSATSTEPIQEGTTPVEQGEVLGDDFSATTTKPLPDSALETTSELIKE